MHPSHGHRPEQPAETPHRGQSHAGSAPPAIVRPPTAPLPPEPLPDGRRTCSRDIARRWRPRLGGSPSPCPDAVRRADHGNCPAEEAHTEGLIGFETFPALFSLLGRGLLGGLVDPQPSPFHRGAAPHYTPPERGGGIVIEPPPLGHNCRLEGNNRGSVHS